MFIRVERLTNAKATLVRGQTLKKRALIYDDVNVGWTFTASQGVNFYLQFRKTSVAKGQFAFSVWFKKGDRNGQDKVWSPEVEEVEE